MEQEKETRITKIPDDMGSYLKMIGRVPLLTGEEEVALGQQVKQMMKCLEIKEKLEEADSVISDEKWAEHLGITKKELKQILSRGQRAKEKMVKANLRLVVSISKKYLGHGLEFLDLIQEGNVGLMRAVEKFEVDKGYKFSTYAYHWIRQALTRAIDNKSRTIRVPIHVTQKLFQLKKKRLEFLQKFGRFPTETELAESINLPLDKIRLWQERSYPVLSLEQPSHVDAELTLGSLIIDPKSDVNDYLETLFNQELVEKLLSELTPTEQQVIQKYYLQTPSLSVYKIGQMLNVSPQTVSLHKKKALKKLSDSLAGYQDSFSDSETESEKKSPLDEMMEMLNSQKFDVVLMGLIKATGCTPSQLLLSYIFEIVSHNGKAQLFLKEGKVKQELPLLVEGELILLAISKLRKSTRGQELLTLSPSSIDNKLLKTLRI